MTVKIYCRNHLLFCMFSLLVLILFLLVARDTFQIDRANDTTSAYYLSYGRNLNRLPISKTRLLNVDLVAPDGKPIFKDTPIGFYRDHPPLLTWSVAVALKIKEVIAQSVSDILAARMVSIVASIGILLMTMYLCLKEFGTSSAIITGIAILSCPVFFSHGLVVNFEPLCCCLILLGFLGNSPFLFLPSLLADWPAFFALPVYALTEFRKGNRAIAVQALTLGLLTGYGIIFLSGYLAGKPDFGLNYVRHVASFEAGRYANHSSDLLQQAKTIVRTMVVTNFGPLNCLILFFGSIRWFLHLKSLNRAQTVAVASVIVTFLNIVLFHTWAAEHSFWSYYLLPAVAIAYADLANARNFKIFILICLMLSSYYSANIYVTQLLPQYPWSSAEGKCPILTSSNSYPVWTDTRHAYFGHGYVARWYFDRPLHYADSPLDASVRATCSTQTCIWLTENQYVSLPKEKFKVYKVGSFANVYLTTFRVK